MTQCLVTKLKGSVSDSSILRLGEFRIKVCKVDSPTAKTQGISLQFVKETDVEIIGDGYFTDRTLSENNGKRKTVPANALTSLFVSNGDFEIAVLDKYSLYSMVLYANTETGITTEDTAGKTFDIGDLKYSTELVELNMAVSHPTGDISALSDLPKIKTLVFDNSSITGDISALEKLTTLTSLNLGGTSVTGDISSIRNLKNLETLSFNRTQIVGDISSIQNLSKLKVIRINYTNISGNISALQNLTALTDIGLSNNPNLSGDISALVNLANLKTIDFSNSAVSGNLSSLSGLTGLTSVLLLGTSVSGNISSLQSLTSLQNTTLVNCTGNISSLTGLSSLKSASFTNSTMTGDLSKLPGTCYFAGFIGNTNTELTWTGRSSTSNIIAITGNAHLSDVDQMLIDQAQCVYAAPITGGSYTTISVVGTRTSASDDAVETLQGKGFTISITPE